MSLSTLQSILLSTLFAGSLYTLMAIGLALVWGTLRVFNFAHGTLLMFGAYVAWTFARYGTVGLALGIPLAICCLFAVGILLERSTVSPFLKRPNAALVAIITTLSASIFLQNLAQIIWGPQIKQLPTIIGGRVALLGTKVSGDQILAMVLAPLLMFGLWLFLKRTKIGLAIRGVEQNRPSALLMGVNVQFIYSFTFGVAAAFAAVAGIMLARTQFIQPDMGSDPLLKAFIVIILGGLGSLGGTLTTAYLIALVEAISVTVLGLYWTPFLLFALMIVVLVVRPSGLFGLQES